MFDRKQLSSAQDTESKLLFAQPSYKWKPRLQTL